METITLNTVEIEISETENRPKSKIEVTLPYFTKWTLAGKVRNAYKIISKDHCISVSDGDHANIQIAHAGLAFHRNENEPAIEEEFESLRKEVLEQLSKL